VYEFDLIALDGGPAGPARGRAGDRARAARGDRGGATNGRRRLHGDDPEQILREAVVFFASVAGRREGGF